MSLYTSRQFLFLFNSRSHNVIALSHIGQYPNDSYIEANWDQKTKKDNTEAN